MRKIEFFRAHIPRLRRNRPPRSQEHRGATNGWRRGGRASFTWVAHGAAHRVVAPGEEELHEPRRDEAARAGHAHALPRRLHCSWFGCSLTPTPSTLLRSRCRWRRGTAKFQSPDSRDVWAWCHPFCTLFIFQFLFLVGINKVLFFFFSRFLLAGMVLPASSSFAWNSSFSI